MSRFYEQISAACSGNLSFALALIAGTKGSSPQRAGAKAIFFAGEKSLARSAVAVSKPKFIRAR